jgi:hypothetical protein
MKCAPVFSVGGSLIFKKQTTPSPGYASYRKNSDLE